MTPAVPAAIRSQELLVNRLAPERYVPPSSGVVTPSRIEIFLRVREKTSDLQSTLNFRLNQGYWPGSLVIINEKTNAVMRRSIRAAILQPLGEYLNARNEALLEAQMSLGEYLYIYLFAGTLFMDRKVPRGWTGDQLCARRSRRPADLHRR